MTQCIVELTNTSPPSPTARNCGSGRLKLCWASALPPSGIAHLRVGGTPSNGIGRCAVSCLTQALHIPSRQSGLLAVTVCVFCPLINVGESAFY